MPPIGGVRAGYLSASKDAIPDSVLYDFESGDMTRFDSVNGINATTTYSYNGSYATEGNGSASDTPFESVVRPTEIEYYWKDYTGSGGHTVGFYNSNGDLELEFENNSPAWYFTSISRTRVADGVSDNTWIRYNANIDWNNDDINVTFEKADGSNTVNQTFNLNNGVDILTMKLSTNGDSLDDIYLTQ